MITFDCIVIVTLIIQSWRFYVNKKGLVFSYKTLSFQASEDKHRLQQILHAAPESTGQPEYCFRLSFIDVFIALLVPASRLQVCNP